MYFPTTQWTLLARASLTEEPGSRQALEELCRRYWTPLHQFIGSRGYTETEAEDLTQEFLLHILEHSTLSRADRLQGRFRSFLLGALSRFLADQYDKRTAQKRGSGAIHLSVDEQTQNLADERGAATRFDREWALVVLENALRSLEAENSTPSLATHFAVLRKFLPGSLETPPYEAAAAQIGVTLPAFKSELHRLRTRFRALVRQELAATVSAPHEIDEEMEHLRRVLMDPGSDLRDSPKPSPPFS